MENEDLIKRMNNYERIVKEIVGAFSLLEFHIVIESTIHKKIIPVNRNDSYDKFLLEDIYIIANNFAAEYNQTLITFDVYKSLLNSPRAKSFRNNEVGVFVDKVIPTFFAKNKSRMKAIESFDRLSLNGYPDEVIVDKYGRTTYIEIKTTSRRDVGSPRDFFFSPLENSKKKIKNDARHLLLCFDMLEQREKEFIITGWCLIDMFNIKVKMKPEFITNNLVLYKEENILFDVNLIKGGK